MGLVFSAIEWDFRRVSPLRVYRSGALEGSETTPGEPCGEGLIGLTPPYD